MNRRKFLERSAATASVVALAGWPRWIGSLQLPAIEQVAALPPAYSVTPVVGDGKWIWNDPPKETGYLEPRPYSMSIGIELQGRGNSSQIRATTTLPVESPEQKIDEETIETDGCDAQVRQLGPYSRQLCVSAGQLAPGQKVSATAKIKLTAYKQFQNYQKDQFPQEQKIPDDVRKHYLGDSPGIETSCKELKLLSAELTEAGMHVWDLAKKFAEWPRAHIKPLLGPYTSVSKALKNLTGDCEEMSAVFVALCRSVNIPARIVWVPNHNWAEFYLVDKQGEGKWIPAHMACYYWFGWTGVHEIVLQKGDRIQVPERSRYFRLTEDWMQWAGRKPDARYPAELQPQPMSGSTDAGPGARRKDTTTGEWKLLADAGSRYVRQ